VRGVEDDGDSSVTIDKQFLYQIGLALRPFAQAADKPGKTIRILRTDLKRAKELLERLDRWEGLRSVGH
jgi:hypothetical protein